MSRLKRTRQSPTPQSIFERLDTNQVHHVTFSGLRELADGVNHTAPHGRVESLQVTSSAR